VYLVVVFYKLLIMKNSNSHVKFYSYSSILIDIPEIFKKYLLKCLASN
jgi:hypothetical protein